ncbi:response regulator [Aequorivita echinoideorum]|uniref:Response regulator n=1 Tax=Aequorivita echinoideorum TaxID=1549647 RepID=A0ABS5S1C1_9FLAO|nr:response regulator [Aequorivita echinoideorum]MBT0607003.1 response regulator [Aequorivita echinoideorum]
MKLPDCLNFLIVEDLVSDSFLLQRQIKKLSDHPEIRFVDTEISLINALKTYIPDMVITDFNLVGMDAFDVIRIIKDYNSKIPVVVITGNLKNEEDSQKLLDAGASGFFLKEPINTLHERLLPVFEKIITQSQKQLETLGNERKKYDNQKAQSDFLREYTFSETNSRKAPQEKESGFLYSILKFFGMKGS